MKTLQYSEDLLQINTYYCTLNFYNQLTYMQQAIIQGQPQMVYIYIAFLPGYCSIIF